MSSGTLLPQVKLKFCSCFSVSTGIKILSTIVLAIWVVFAFDTFVESSIVMFSLSCIGCLYNLIICSYVSITTSKMSSYFMLHPLLVILVSNIDVLLSVVVVVVAHTAKPEWEQGGLVTHERVSNMTVQVLLATICYALALNSYYLSFGEDGSLAGAAFKDQNSEV
eukprot:GFUD01041749.1.p1 GENE.GFUD01041749.1~~GFUD01041749.1.p1  ORF type:complete len:194 (-),score=31.05 GFUD01041749.1:148-645(-)